MSLTKFVKIGSISNLSDARYCAGMMVDILGFEIANENSQHYVNPSTFQELTEWVAGVSFAGECHNTTIDKLSQVIQKYQIQYIELNQLEILKAFHDKTDKLFIFHYQFDGDLSKLKEVLEQADQYAEYIIITASDYSDVEAIDEVISRISISALLLRSYQITTSTVSQLSSNWHGIELKGTVEEKAGYKDYGVVMDILEAMEVD